MQPLTPEQSLNNLVLASRQARLTYDEHATIEKSAMTLQAALVELQALQAKATMNGDRQ